MWGGGGDRVALGTDHVLAAFLNTDCSVTCLVISCSHYFERHMQPYPPDLKNRYFAQ